MFLHWYYSIIRNVGTEFIHFNWWSTHHYIVVYLVVVRTKSTIHVRFIFYSDGLMIVWLYLINWCLDPANHPQSYIRVLCLQSEPGEVKRAESAGGHWAVNVITSVTEYWSRAVRQSYTNATRQKVIVWFWYKWMTMTTVSTPVHRTLTGTGESPNWQREELKKMKVSLQSCYWRRGMMEPICVWVLITELTMIGGRRV